MVVKWNDSYKVGVPSLDAQHKKLFVLLGEVVNSIRDKKSGELKSKLLGELFDYTATHFSAEEKLMLETGYPGYEEHKKKHKELALKVKKYWKNFNAGAVILNSEIIDCLLDWLKFHIAETDKEYGPYLTGKGIK